ncbi:MAG: hypothetical protein A3H96_20035 [Acidobacteria bacterium RIFCSPLOWO2_02_FULL_67_36]|nr:MAG: hypothetical protein A3H96_20035 [Acidobacteria bacterium RIFCSPLOWO2_02_FULL_67_36]OFW23331.1 MAG: hypothetical protein A3G21_10540 [Acidobacteria bacterium RIFCSPLOWO2_12_FULL_66_21]
MFGVAPGLFGSQPRRFGCKAGGLLPGPNLLGHPSEAFVRPTRRLGGRALLLGNLAVFLRGLTLLLTAVPVACVLDSPA